MTLHLLSNVLINVIPYVVHKIAEKKTRNNLFFSLYLSFESFSWIFKEIYLFYKNYLYSTPWYPPGKMCGWNVSAKASLSKIQNPKNRDHWVEAFSVREGLIDHVVKLYMHWYIIQLQSFPSSRNMLQFHKIYHLILFFSWI